MSIPERDRRELFERLDAVLGSGPADTIMKLLPTQPASELLTRTEFHEYMAGFRIELRAEQQADMAEFRAEQQADMAEFRAEMRADNTEIRGEITGIRGEMAGMRGEMAEMRGEMAEMRGEYRAGMASTESALRTSMNRWAIAMATSNTIAVVTALIT